MSVFAAARRGLDRATIYLPIILTATLALGTYWLVRNAPKLVEPTAAKAATHEPDFFMRGFVVKSFLPSGTLHSEVAGTEGRHYPDDDTMEIDQVRMRSVAPTGSVTHASANRGLANGDASEIQLFGGAIVTRDAMTDPSGKPLPKMEFRGEFLHAFIDTERVRSHKPVVLTRGADRFTGDSMDYDSKTGIVNLQGRVHGRLAPSIDAAPKPR